MAKDAYWFRHDSNASRDLKMMRLKHIYDFWGIGLYWSVIELLREQDNYCFKSDESSLQLASSLVSCSDTFRFLSWFNDAIKLELLINENGMFFSESLCKRMQNWETKKTNGNNGGRPKKTETKTETKPKHKPKHKPKRNHKSIEDNKRKEIGDIFFDEKLKLECEYFAEGKRYGNMHQRWQGGLSDMAISEHCKSLGIEYLEGSAYAE